MAKGPVNEAGQGLAAGRQGMETPRRIRPCLYPRHAMEWTPPTNGVIHDQPSCRIVMEACGGAHYWAARCGRWATSVRCADSTDLRQTVPQAAEE